MSEPITDFLSHHNRPIPPAEVPSGMRELVKIAPSLARSAVYYHSSYPRPITCHIFHGPEGIRHQYTFLRKDCPQQSLTLMEYFQDVILPEQTIQDIKFFTNLANINAKVQIQFAHPPMLPTVFTAERQDNGMTLSYGLNKDFTYYTLSLETAIYFNGVCTMLQDIRETLIQLNSIKK